MILNVIMNEKVQSISTTMKESPVADPLTPVTRGTIQLSRSSYCFLSLQFSFDNRSYSSESPLSTYPIQEISQMYNFTNG